MLLVTDTTPADSNLRKKNYNLKNKIHFLKEMNKTYFKATARRDWPRSPKIPTSIAYAHSSWVLGSLYVENNGTMTALNMPEMWPIQVSLYLDPKNQLFVYIIEKKQCKGVIC